MDHPDVILGAVLCVAAIVNVVIEYRRFADHRHWCSSMARAEGVVSRVGRRGWSSRNEPTSTDHVATVPVVRFRAANGVEYEFDAGDAPRKVGAPVQVAYDPELPSTAYLVERTKKLGCAFLFAAAGLFLIVRALL